MGYVSAVGNCYSCGKIFSFNPRRVPSIKIEGDRKPICRACIEISNPKRVANGLEPIEIKPDAYEACDESELWWEED